MPYHAKNIIVGCDQYLFKDDGFGPFVIKALNDYFEDKQMPGETMFIDAGNSAPFHLFTLPDEYWEKIIVIDIVLFDGEPGEIREFSPYDMPKGMFECAHTYTVEDVVVGLTDPLLEAIPKVIDMIFKEIGYETDDKVTLKDYDL